MGLFDKIKKIGIFKGFSKLDDEFYDNLEESMILADMGVETTLKAVDQLRGKFGPAAISRGPLTPTTHRLHRKYTPKPPDT